LENAEGILISHYFKFSFIVCFFADSKW